jgi:hypothetical protein
MKENSRDEPIGIILHIYMEISLGNSLCSYLYLKLAKMSFFSFFFFYSTKSENKRVEQVLPRREGWHQCGGRSDVERR